MQLDVNLETMQIHIWFFGLFVLVAKGEEQALWIVDTDAGADDAVALSLLLGAESLQKNVKIIGITAVSGNTNSDNVVLNVLKVLDTVTRLDIPVYQGLNTSLLYTPPSDNFFGEDGFGDFEYPDPPSPDLVQEMHAVNFLIDNAKNHSGEINLLCLGPLTNIALAIKLDPTFWTNLKEVVVLGGSVEGVGNISPGVEFNVYVDPEATSIVLQEASEKKKPLRLMPWEAALKLQIPMEWRKNTLGQIPNALISLLNKAENISSTNDADWISSDALAAIWAFDEDFPVETNEFFGMVETCGTYSRGSTLIDYKKEKSDENLFIAQPGSLDREYVQNLMVDILKVF